MNFKAIATRVFMADIDSDEEAIKVYDAMVEFSSDGGAGEPELPDYITPWQPLENYDVDELLELIDDLALKFNMVYERGRVYPL